MAFTYVVLGSILKLPHHVRREALKAADELKRAKWLFSADHQGLLTRVGLILTAYFSSD